MSDGFQHDHDATENLAKRFGTYSDDLENSHRRHHTRAKAAFGRTRGKGGLAAAAEQGVSKLLDAMQDGQKALRKHLKDVGQGLEQTSRNHRDNDRKIADIMLGKHSGGSGPKSPGGSGGGGGSNRRGPGRKGGSRKPGSPRLRDGAGDPRKTGVQLNSRNTCGDPVDVASGEMVMGQEDVSLPGALPLLLTRTHLSSYRSGRWFGPSWTSTLDQRLELDDEGVVFATDDGMLLVFPVPRPDRPVHPVEGPRWELAWDPQVPGCLTVCDPFSGVTRHFVPLTPDGGAPGDLADQSLLPLAAISDRNGHRIDIAYSPQGAPVEVRHSGGYRVGVETAGRRITGFRLLDPAGTDTQGAAGTGQAAGTEPEPAAGTGPQAAGNAEQAVPGAPAAGEAAATEPSAPSGPAAAPRPEPEGTLLVAFSYDGNGNLSQVMNSSGVPLEFTYDHLARITTWTDRNRHRYRYLYDRAGRCVQTRGDGGFLDNVFSYDTDNRTTTVTNALGQRTVYQLNELGQTVAETDPLGHVTRSLWDPYDRLLERTDQLGRTTTLSWDEDGNLSRISRPDGSFSQAVYNDLHQPLEVTTADGAVEQFTYDDRGNLLTATDPAGALTRYVRDEHGNADTVTDALGATTRFTYNPAGLTTTITGPLGGTSTCAYDAFGLPARITDPLGTTTLLGWTIEGRPAWRTDAAGNTERWAYDGEGNCVRHTDPGGGTSTFEYTYFDLLAARTDPDGAHYRFDYDPELKLTRITNPHGLTWTYEHDVAGRLVSERDFNGRTVTYSLDAAGHPTELTNGAGQRTAFTRDPLGRTVARHADGATTTFRYDAGGHLLEAANADATVTFTYDAAGRVLTETCNGASVHRAYDPLGRTTVRQTPSGAESRWTYDAAGRPRQLHTGSGHTLAFAHDLAGRETSRQFGAAALTHTFDDGGRLTGQQLTAAPGTRAASWSRAWAYSPTGYVTATSGPSGEVHHQDLDPAGRVTAVTGANWTERYTYDEAGNLTGADWPTAGGNDGTEADAAVGERTHTGMQLTTAGRTTYEYDQQGRLVRQRRRLLSGGHREWRYTWDTADRLTHLTTPDGSLWQYLYDPFGRRIAKQRLATDRHTVLEETRFVWDGTNLAEQTRTDPDTGTAHTSTWDWEPDGERPLAQRDRTHHLRDATQDEIDERFYAIVSDLVGAPTELVDEHGTVAWHLRTTLWGAPGKPAPAPRGPDCPLRFPGQQADAESGLHYNLFRYYDPLTARYLSPDPLGLRPALNPQTYVHNPQTWADPFGLAPCPTHLGKMASEIAGLLPKRSQEYQTVAVIEAMTPKGPKLFAAGTSSSPLTPAQQAHAKKLGLIPLPSSEYSPKTDDFAGHAEQNLLAFLARRHQTDSAWRPLQGGASRSVCTDHCAPLIRGSGGRMVGDGEWYFPRERGTHRRLFTWLP
ncbi:hypothetical protein GCM10010441_68290 [Kitasatospora paracochleata]|uniref:RHS repeat-associated protein n=1 Tax=Kitasatospora paracochleata TaxID=58354 RepID=A0ABT1J959_9ACTN|nr:DUF6531 domain-containing protein [Kitasatospora paracochleata]MCP2313985.1 RHS repeat-associated protein [Kitasatospora paracochleata]